MVKVHRDLTQLYHTLINISYQGMGTGEGSQGSNPDTSDTNQYFIPGA